MIESRSRPGGKALTASIVLHAVGFGLLFAGVARPSPVPEFVTMRVDLVAAPTPVVETTEPEPQPSPSEPEPAPPVAEEEPEPVPTEEPEPEEEAQPVEETPVDTTEAEPSPTPSEAVGTGEDAVNMSMEGLEFAYPDYLENIITQINRFFRWTGTSRPTAEVYFVINRDGSVGDIRLVRRSGNAAFDFEAIGAIEQAGRRRAFGPLPEGFPADRLQLRFEFRPPG